MIHIPKLRLGFRDAENYQRRENKDLFNSIFVQNAYLEDLLKPNSFFLIGEKGTGKTAYSVFLANNYYHDTISELKYIRETDYQKFVTLKKQQHLQLSDYASIWQVIILLLLAKAIEPEELDHNPLSKKNRIKAVLKAIDDYYQDAFSPEIVCALDWVENSKITAELVSKSLRLGGENVANMTTHESRFQVNLLFLEKHFKQSLSELKLRSNHILFIDGIDIRPGTIDEVAGVCETAWRVK